MLIAVLFVFLQGSLAPVPSLLFDLPEAGAADSAQPGLVALLIPGDMEGAESDGTLVYFDDARYVMSDRVSLDEFSSRLGERAIETKCGVLTLLSDRRVPAGDIMKIMSLAEPTSKMSKSDENQNAVVYILDSKDDIIRKFKRAVTDSDASVKFSEEKLGISNLITIYSAVTGKTVAEIEKEFDGKGYGDFKLAVGEAVVEELRPIRENYERLIKDKAELERLYKEGAAKAVEALRGKGVQDVIVTMGSKGSMVYHNGQPTFVPSKKVNAIDTTAAGDTYCGGLCVALSEGKDIIEAAQFATASSALTVQKRGAQDSIPYRKDVIL